METLVINFSSFKVAVAKQFERMQKHPMFRTQATKGEMWAAYLGSFPPGSNPMFRERTEHDCSCCRHFIRDVGNVIAIAEGGDILTIWDAPTGEPAYNIVTKALRDLVISRPIEEPFLHYERTAGTDKNYEQRGTPDVRTWNHFFVNIAPGFVTSKDLLQSTVGEQRTTHQMLARALAEIPLEAVDTVIDMIAQGALYRGDEHKFALTEFRKLKCQHTALLAANDGAAQTFLWTAAKTAPASVSRIRSTVIGTLLTDLVEGKDLEASVAAFEVKVAPTNYKRPTALITKGMIEKAKKTIEELGLTSALERRYATLSDININNILFANRGARKALTGNVFDDLSSAVGDRVTKTLDSVDEVPIDRFITEILPRAESIEVLLENRHAGNLVSLIAPAHPSAGLLFKWPNAFSWSYAGELADSMKERVKKAGGNVTGDLCCRLAWYNHDDLDSHMHEPTPRGHYGAHIYFGAKGPSPSGGRLDVDMNAGGGHTREPVENIYYGDRMHMHDGKYTLSVNQYSKRENKDGGFEAEIDYLGTVHRFAYGRMLRAGENVIVAVFNYTRKGGFEIIESLPMTQAVRSLWGVPTQTFHQVNVLMLSPNFWDGIGGAGYVVGNKHYFFMLEGCANDGSARGFFNEFLMASLDQHRKVFEVVGSKMTVAPANQQLSGLGFSSTQKNTLTCRVKGSFSRIIKIVF